MRETLLLDFSKATKNLYLHLELRLQLYGLLLLMLHLHLLHHDIFHGQMVAAIDQELVFQMLRWMVKLAWWIVPRTATLKERSTP